jgi:hypothetical protein
LPTKEPKMSAAMKTFRNAAMFPLLLLGLSACGGGGGGASSPPLKKVTLAFSTISAAHSVPIEGIDLGLQLPSGVIADSTCTVTWRNSATLKAMGTPDAAHGIVNLALGDLNGIKFGAFADVTCDLASGSNLTAGDFATSAIVTRNKISGTLSGNTVFFPIDIGATATISNR